MTTVEVESETYWKLVILLEDLSMTCDQKAGFPTKEAQRAAEILRELGEL